MNREVKSQKVKGRGKVFTSPCSAMNCDHQIIMVGSPACLKCEYFVKVLNKEGKVFIHCNNAK